MGIYPAGVYSHGLSAKHAARFSSPDVPIPDDYELWVRATGGGGATVRYVVHDYPRQGTVYPVTKLGGWKWHRYDLSYWSGEEIHVELATAADAPLLVEDADRSWFGVREVLLQPKGAAAPPAEPLEHFDPLFALAKGRPPQSFAALADLYVDALAKSVRAWHDGRATDGDAFLLGAALRQELLPNRLSNLPQVAQLIAEYRDLESDVPVPTRVPSLQETAGRDNPLFERGDHRQPRDLVPRRFLEAIDATPYTTAGSGRLQLAEDLLRDDNPFTRRVIVNRLWHHLFGAGIVATPDNFGRLGETPTHPELLDWLAIRFERDVFLALAGRLRQLPRLSDALFLGWFGPIGVAAVFYSSVALRRTGLQEAWTTGSLLVCASIAIHGLTATPLTRFYGKRAGRGQEH